MNHYLEILLADLVLRGSGVYLVIIAISSMMLGEAHHYIIKL